MRPQQRHGSHPVDAHSSSVGSRSSIKVVIAGNVIKLVECPNDAIEPTKSDVAATAKSWTLAGVARRSETPSGNYRKGFSRLQDSRLVANYVPVAQKLGFRACGQLQATLPGDSALGDPAIGS